MEMIYVKKGRKYVPIQPFAGFPVDGIWLVRRKSQSSTLTTYLDDLGNKDMRVIVELSKRFNDIENFFIEMSIETSKEWLNASEKARRLIGMLAEFPELDDTESHW